MVSPLNRLEHVAREHLERGWHSGAQLTVYRQGFIEVEIALGAATGKWMLWFSASKPVTAVAIHMLAERGELDLDRPVTDVWPEFGAGGKAACTTRHILTHQGGFPVFPPDFDWDNIDDWDAVAEATAALPAEWEPGTAVGYHPLTYGFALGEIIHRVDGRTPRGFIRDEIIEPLSLDASLGVNKPDGILLPEAMSEVTFQDPEGSERRTSAIAERFSRPSTLRAQIPAANMVGTAEALARFYMMLAGGGELDGASLLSPSTVAEATLVHARTEADRTTGLPAAYGLGFVVDSPFSPFDQEGVFGHTGQQSVLSYADPSRNLGVAYVTNGMQDPHIVQVRTEEMVQAINEAFRP